MENTEITVEDLQKGDEVIVHGNGYLRYVKLLRPMKLAKNTNYIGDTIYSRVKCSFIDTGGWQRPNTLRGEDHNKEGYIDFNYRNI